MFSYHWSSNNEVSAWINVDHDVIIQIFGWDCSFDYLIYECRKMYKYYTKSLSLNINDSCKIQLIDDEQYLFGNFMSQSVQ